MSDRSNKTEQASARRKEEARKKGQVAISRDLSIALALMAGIGVLYATSGSVMRSLIAMLREWLGMAMSPVALAELTEEGLRPLLLHAMATVLPLTLPLMACVAVVATGATLAQTGFMWRRDAWHLDLSRVSPLAGLRRLWSLRSTVELVKAGCKLAAVATVAVLSVERDLRTIPAWGQLDLAGFLGSAGWIMLKTALSIGAALVALAGADYAYQWFDWQRNLKMTREERKEELRDTEGDPILRARVRSVQRDMSRKRMMAAVPKADVVVTNPTHVAVALRYDQQAMAAPIVVAKGAGYLAQRIKEVAREHGVPVVEQPVIARSLYKLVDIGREIPSDLYRAVAELFAYIYRVKGIGLRVGAASSIPHARR